MNLKSWLHRGAVGVLGVVGWLPCAADEVRALESRPNVILIMFDDLGYADTGFMGSRQAATPHMDAMASSALVFTRFYSAAPVCSPTRGSVLTGRHPYRYGIYFANVGSLPADEITIPFLLGANGYRTGHFGKWHLGTMTTEIDDANRGGKNGRSHFAPPWTRGFDVAFSTESKVPTFDPLIQPRDFSAWPGNLRQWWDPVVDDNRAVPYGTRYWNERGESVTENIRGPDARVVMDRALPFMEACVRDQTPFLAVIWFHEPHWPVVAGADDAGAFPDLDRFDQHYYGCIRAADREIGRLRGELRRLGVADTTMIWVASDNGPEGDADMPGSAHPLRGRKRSLYEGGLRVPAMVEWPARIPAGRVTDYPAVTSDYLPTLLDVTGLRMPDARPLDGVSLLPLITGRPMPPRAPIGFQSQKQLALIGERYKIYSPDEGRTFELYDLIDDMAEAHDLAASHPELMAGMKTVLDAWRASCDQPISGTTKGAR